eukprot:1351391-Amorphochlora_amoeboformis.AAC.3
MRGLNNKVESSKNFLLEAAVGQEEASSSDEDAGEGHEEGRGKEEGEGSPNSDDKADRKQVPRRMRKLHACVLGMYGVPMTIDD